MTVLHNFCLKEKEMVSAQDLGNLVCKFVVRKNIGHFVRNKTFMKHILNLSLQIS